MDDLIAHLPPHAQDVSANLRTLIGESAMTEAQKWGCILACAYAGGVPRVMSWANAEAATRLNATTAFGARAAATVMAMNTVYYDAIHALHNHDYRGMRANLQMHAMSGSGADKTDFELWALAVSAMLGCPSCTNTHEAELHKRDVTPERIQAALRIAAVMNALNVVVRAENAT